MRRKLGESGVTLVEIAATVAILGILANLYSLYGHLSPSRWKQESGTDVKRADLIAYLGDPDENGGSV